MTGNHFVAYRTLRAGVVRVEAELLDFAYPAHSHDHVCIGLARSGEHSCRYGLHRYTVQAGDLMLVNPGEVHDGRPSGRCGRRYSMLEVAWPTFTALCLDAVGRERLEFHRSVMRAPVARDLLASWLACLGGSDPASENETAALLFGQVFASVCEHVTQKAAGGLAERARRRMRDDWTNCDSVGAVAAELGASRYQIIRAFKRTFGLTPEDFRRQLRIERARSRLPSREPLADIACAAGFADQSHMTREFRRLVGITPDAYRRAFQ